MLTKKQRSNTYRPGNYDKLTFLPVDDIIPQSNSAINSFKRSQTSSLKNSLTSNITSSSKSSTNTSKSRISQLEKDEINPCIKFYLRIKQFSLFYRRNGIYHHGHLKHVSFVSFVSSVIVILYMLWFTIDEFYDYNRVKDIDTYKTQDLNLLNGTDENKQIVPQNCEKLNKR